MAGKEVAVSLLDEVRKRGLFKTRAPGVGEGQPERTFLDIE
jgi:hypothetical protein